MSAHCQVIGRIGNNPELRNAGNSKVCAISVASESGFGENKRTTWWKVEAWGKLAEKLAQHARKGNLVFAAGEFELEEYKDREQKLRFAPKCRATNVNWYSTQQAQEHEDAFQKHYQAEQKKAGYGASPSYPAGQSVDW